MTPKRNFDSCTQSVPRWFWVALPQGRKVSSSRCCAVPYPMLMRSSTSRLRRWLRQLLFAPDLQPRAPQPQCCKTRRRFRGKTPVEPSQSHPQCFKTRRRLRWKTAVDVRALAVVRVRVKSQRRSSSIMTANITSWGRHYLEQEKPIQVVLQEHHLAQADSIGWGGYCDQVTNWYYPHLGLVEMAPKERIVAAHVDACVPNGFTLVGLYLVCEVK